MAGKVPGSQVIICTDGQANVGLGSMNNPDTNGFYSTLASQAKSAGVSVSVMRFGSSLDYFFFCPLR